MVRAFEMSVLSVLHAGSGGVIVPPATYFDKVQAVLKRYDVLFLVDEVICGFGRWVICSAARPMI